MNKPGSKPDGGQAFPLDVHDTEGPGFYNTGMSLRDWFAGMALQGMASYTNRQATGVAATAYAIADAMIAERDKQ